jgi:hypothetical protein
MSELRNHPRKLTPNSSTPPEQDNYCLVQLKIATDAPRLLGFAILIWTIPAQIVRIDIASSATGASGRIERRQHAA